ncbi:hypothetical protein C7457_0115 [Thermovibrio guaymasensis]|uniref:Flagellar assembly protein FliH n=1 Tax=Thermovibrio guaymasensis TaxID=240167 RepID=A0A420W7J3_9BACT|nr:hypothetical protein [Thermovibrio guaymasensis]RKQ63252.1 hypothetical protein C7457_0115 [Thermovibrio guaymasensis]
MLDLEDFSSFIEVKKSSDEVPQQSQELTLKRLEEKYRQEILKLQASFKKELQRVKEEAYKNGFEEGYAKGLKEKEKDLIDMQRRISEQFQSELKKLKVNLDSLIEGFKNEKEGVLEKIKGLILDSLLEIFEFLYLNPSNSSYLRKKIDQILEEFEKEELVSIEVGEKLAQVLEGERVKVSSDIGAYDFRIVFKDFFVESNFKEKLNILREELEREIKKTS